MNTQIQLKDETVQSISELAIQARTLQESVVKGVYINPEGDGFLDVRDHEVPKPYIVESPTFARTDSFNEYVERFKDDRTLIFASLGSANVVARLDYYTPRNEGNNADWNKHSPVLVMKRTPEWEKWKEGHDDWLSQVEFAELIEDLQLSISEPDGARIAEMVMKFEDTRQVNFKSNVNRTDGSITFNYSDQSGTAGTMKVPDRFTVDLRPFEASEPIQALAHIRYRVGEGSVRFKFVFERFDEIERRAFETVLEQVEAGTGLKPLVQP